MLKTSLPDYQTINAAALYAVTCAVCMHIILLQMLY